MTDAVNRLLWTALGLALLGGGALGAAAALGHVPGTDTESPLLWRSALEGWRSAEGWAPFAVAGGGLLAVVLGVLLLRAQLRTGPRPVREIQLPPGATPGQGAGSTRVRGGALAGCLSDDLRRLGPVQGAHVRLSGTAQATRVAVRLDAAADVDVDTLAGELAGCLDRFVRTTGTRLDAVEVTVRLREREVARVS